MIDKVAKCKSKEYQIGYKKMKGSGGAGKLTKVAIKRIQEFKEIQGHYGGAIRKNSGDLDKMKGAAWAIWRHRKMGLIKNVVSGVMVLTKISCQDM